MKKIGLVFKETSQGRIKIGLKDAQAALIIKYSGVKSPDLCSLRLSLKGGAASLFVVKNSVARRAFKDSGLDSLVKTLEGPCGIIFTKDEPVEASKILFNFLKDHEQLKIEGGILKDKLLERKDLELMAKLPSKQGLRAQVVCTLNGPIQGLVMALGQTLNKLVICLDQIRQKKTS
ncbi:MAG: 50S ribosomal protein L10 [Candidatus Omnitrophota bacterium]